MELESEPATDADAEQAAAAGLTLVRCIDQLRIPLPLSCDTTPLATRPFVPGLDDDAFLEVNNRAFAWHPDQSGWTSQHLQERMQQAWFDPAGFLLHERDGRLAGFCWTKIHPASDAEPELGEIFVIAVDPDFHGLGLGRALTIAGLRSLAARSVAVGMLHVEHDNLAARNLYEDLGFRKHDSHCWWSLREADS